MTPDERLAELGSLLATAYRRLRLTRQNGLATSANHEAPSDAAVDGDGAAPAQEDSR